MNLPASLTNYESPQYEETAEAAHAEASSARSEQVQREEAQAARSGTKERLVNIMNADDKILELAAIARKAIDHLPQHGRATIKNRLRARINAILGRDDTAYLLASPANKKRLLESIQQVGLGGTPNEKDKAPAQAEIAIPQKPTTNLVDNGSKMVVATPGAAGAMTEAQRGQYLELIMAVARKFPNETRHQTALRYINEAESRAEEGQASCSEYVVSTQKRLIFQRATLGYKEGELEKK